ncbi:hypothetical protein F0M18_10070 [Pseudohalioglobus sediminis]|uniref:Uncharacterized protein n=1 Tax=Pseudohalioglobus sediminis TaxID=2606449 RepID=A0A5B0WXW5_9GAMM|nr:hypothetical protein [Pseudohalioglobus sediminis]KAA1191866.1 hypothetical protein F0M18_10070 [Pseudohalioglobus sediminis]
MLPEVEQYMAASREFEAGKVVGQLWKQALSLADNDRLAAKYLYLSMRAEALAKQEPASQLAPPAGSGETSRSGAMAATPLNRRGRQTPEDDYHAIAANEVDSGQRDERTWRDALVLAKGDAAAARHHYICLRMDTMRMLAANESRAGEAGA